MKPSEIFLHGCLASSVMLVGVVIINAMKPDNNVREARHARYNNVHKYKLSEKDYMQKT
jgi:hypothetical protein